MTGLLQTPIAHLHLSNEETQQHGPVQQPRSCRRRGGGCRKFVIQNVRFVVCEIIVGQEIDCPCSLTENSTYKYASFVIGKGYVEECGQTSMNDDSFVGYRLLSLRATAHEPVGATDHVSRCSSTLLFVCQQCCFFCSLATPFLDVLDIAVLSATPFRQTNFCDISYAWDWLVVEYISGTWSNRTGHVQAPGVTNNAAQQYCWTRRDKLQLAMVYNPFCVCVIRLPRTNAPTDANAFFGHTTYFLAILFCHLQARGQDITSSNVRKGHPHLDLRMHSSPRPAPLPQSSLPQQSLRWLRLHLGIPHSDSSAHVSTLPFLHPRRRSHRTPQCKRSPSC